MKRFPQWVLLLAAGLLVGRAGDAAAGPPHRLLFPFKRVEADPRKSYELREENGPWLIVAATFLGPSGQRQAQRLVLELRRRYKLAAYTYKKRFDYGKTVRGLGVDKFGRPKRMKHIHSPQFEEIAVLVGDFRSVEDPEAQKALEKIKYARPEALAASPSNPTSQRLALWREIQQLVSPNPELKKKGPMRSAFLTRNPLLPDEYFAPKGPDRLILQLNQGLPYSLLDCPGQYTVRVATFRGHSTWNLHEIQQAQHQVRLSVWDRDSKLAQAGKKATQLTFALRKRGIEAYQFHDRHESIVTIGSFDTVGQRRRDGKIEINPAIHQIMKTYGATVRDLPGLPGAMMPRTLDSIPFDAQPMPVKVPRLSITASLAEEPR